jgi:SAM-dependent methyltransferase
MICTRKYERPADHDEDYFRRQLEEAPKFFSRFEGRLDVKGKSVLDVGCGFGASCVYAALSGAARIVGVDTDLHRLAFAKAKLADGYASLSEVVEFRTPFEVGEDEKFDVILSQNSFQHYDNPETLVEQWKGRLKAGGAIVIGFGPLWKSPYGGPIEFMTPLPWAHLLFPERVIMRERRRFRPDEEAETFAEIRGGLNKMTLQRFVRIIASAGLRFEYFETNVGETPRMRLFRLLRRIPLLGDYLTVNVYSIVRADRGEGDGKAGCSDG